MVVQSQSLLHNFRQGCAGFFVSGVVMESNFFGLSVNLV